jgi:hypothetical protein
MIDTVRGFLREHGLVRGNCSICNVIIGRSFIFEIFQRPSSYLVIKASKSADLQREFECQATSYSALPEFVPEPIAFGASRGLFLLASQGVPHVRLTMRSVRRSADRLSEGIGEYVRRSAAAFTHTEPCSEHPEELEKIIGDLQDLELAAVLRCHMQRLDMERLRLLPHTRQHGDLVANNIGLTRRTPVLFDWEDFGRVQLPGFDVALLLVSFLNFDAVRLKHWFERNEPRELDGIVTTAVDHLGIGRSTLWMWLPVYLAHFLHLKTAFGYRTAIRDQVRGLLEDLCQRTRPRVV